MPNSKSGVRSNYTKFKMYWDLVKNACEKWRVPYLNLFDGSVFVKGRFQEYSDIFEVRTTRYLENDYIHPNIDGYRKISPFILQWMKEL